MNRARMLPAPATGEIDDRGSGQQPFPEVFMPNAAARNALKFVQTENSLGIIVIKLQKRFYVNERTANCT